MSEMDEFNQQIIAEFRANGGVVGGPFEGAPVLLLSTTGAKTGAPRINPLMYYAEGDTIYVFASFGGAPKSPSWYYNALASGTATVEVGTETYPARATDVTGAERDRIYAAQAALFPQFAEYEASTTRTIPVLALNRA
jgi:deazaflavin-dependent oxidoreductase (nitroreductase family)